MGDGLRSEQARHSSEMWQSPTLGISQRDRFPSARSEAVSSVHTHSIRSLGDNARSGFNSGREAPNLGRLGPWQGSAPSAGGPAGAGPGLTAAKALPGPGQVTLFPSWKH